MHCLLDSRAEASFVQQHWAKQHLPDIDSPVCQVTAINDTTVKSYGSQELHLTIGDTHAELQDHIGIMESVDMTEYNLILGYFWLERVDLDI